LRREENRRTRRKTLVARERINNKLKLTYDTLPPSPTTLPPLHNPTPQPHHHHHHYIIIVLLMFYYYNFSSIVHIKKCHQVYC
jgi:hypothetical protein